ncbi:MAG: galactokinase [Actinobacteria bacterium]|nr:galactokinase [Actinomycetota bacterium]
MITARAPGRVNLIGDHTDYTGGLVLPMAIDLATTVEGEPGGDTVVLSSADEGSEAVVPLDVADPPSVSPPWARYVAGVVAVMRPAGGLRGSVSTTLPLGAGLSSSAALEVAVALALGFDGTPLALAHLCQSAEQVASGVPCGIMDQLASAAGVEGHALLIDCTSLDVTPVRMPDAVDVWVVHSGVPRGLAGSAYADRRAECDEAAARIGPLRAATVADASSLSDPLLRRRARHVVTENERVGAFADALTAGDIDELGPLMTASHASLRDDFEVSIPVLDELVDRLAATPGVIGARLTGAGFGGCVVALAHPGATLSPGARRVRAATGASLTTQ